MPLTVVSRRSIFAVREEPSDGDHADLLLACRQFPREAEAQRASRCFQQKMSASHADAYFLPSARKQNEHAMSVVQTRDGDYVLAGFTFSRAKRKSDIWVMKLSRSGEKIWERYLGGKGFDWPNAIIETRDGNYSWHSVHTC